MPDMQSQVLPQKLDCMHFSKLSSVTCRLQKFLAILLKYKSSEVMIKLACMHVPS